jgi:TRAP-type C4-dicarboxylate transport system substrate-binding protein
MNQNAYDGLSDQAKEALDALAGKPLSKSAEDAWHATADAAIQAARDSGDNTVIDLSEEEIAAFAEAVAPVTQSYVDAVGGADALAAMRGN